MFVKLVKSGFGKPISRDCGAKPGVVAPSQEIVYDVDTVEYKKWPPLDEKEPMPELAFGEDGPQMPFDFPIRNKEEYLEILARKNGDSRHVIASGCTMYIMNDNGKTIQKVSCWREDEKGVEDENFRSATRHR